MDERELARCVALGKADADELRRLGIELTETAAGWYLVEAPSHRPRASLAYAEAVETIAMLRDAPARLRRWAVLFEAGVFDIQGIGDGETAEPLLDLLWRVSFGETPTTGEVEALRASTDEP